MAWGRAGVGGRRRGVALAGSDMRGGFLSVWLGLPDRIHLSALTRPFAERWIREALGKGGNFAECPDPAVGIDFFLNTFAESPVRALGKEEISKKNSKNLFVERLILGTRQRPPLPSAMPRHSAKFFFRRFRARLLFIKFKNTSHVSLRSCFVNKMSEISGPFLDTASHYTQ